MKRRVICAIALIVMASRAFAEDQTPTAAEFCVGRRVGDAKVIPFPCESFSDESDVPSFLAAMRIICSNCFVVLQDAVANKTKPGDKPVSAKDLERLLTKDPRVVGMLAAKTIYNSKLYEIMEDKKEEEAQVVDELVNLKKVTDGDIAVEKRN